MRPIRSETIGKAKNRAQRDARKRAEAECSKKCEEGTCAVAGEDCVGKVIRLGWRNGKGEHSIEGGRWWYKYSITMDFNCICGCE